MRRMFSSAGEPEAANFDYMLSTICFQDHQMNLLHDDRSPKPETKDTTLSEKLARAQAFGGVFPFEMSQTDGRFVTTDGLRTLLGIDGHGALAAFMARVAENDRARVTDLLARADADPMSFEFELRLRIVNSTERLFLMRGVQSGPAGVSGVLIDISHSRMLDNRRVLDAEEMRKQHLSFAAIADAMPQMVWSTRPDGFHDYYNSGWYRFTGAPAGSTDGDGWNEMFHPDDQARAWKLWSHALATGEPYEIEYRLRHHSGDYHWVLGRAKAVRNDKGEIIRWFGTCTDINDTKKAAEYVELLSQELSHRIKNIFAIIQSLVGLSGRRAPESAGFAKELQARIAALGRAHDLARPHSDQSRPHRGGVTLHGLAREILKPYLAMDDGRISIMGEDVPVDDSAATPLALILHELATNAKKYGALSTSEGRVHIFSACAGEHCQLSWTESGGPVVTGEPATTGFGTKLVLASAQSHLNGTIKRQWDAGGLVVTVTCPRSSLVRGNAKAGFQP